MDSKIDPSYTKKVLSYAPQTSRQRRALSIETEVEHCYILVIYTGGTIGMKSVDGVYIPVNNHFTKLLRKMPNFFDSSYNFSGDASETFNLFPVPLSEHGVRTIFTLWEYSPLLDSCDMTMDDWIRIVRDIQTEYDNFDGFVVLHGTDTLAYTAAALSFMLENLSKPVIVTGSQIPIIQLRSDGAENLMNSFYSISHCPIAEVTVCFRGKIFRGNRCRKFSSMKLSAFESPNYPALAEFGTEIIVNETNILKRPAEDCVTPAASQMKVTDGNSPHRLSVETRLCADVTMVRLFPSITRQIIHAFLAEPVRGVVLQSYGSGNMPVCRRDLIDELEEACKRGVIIINTSQCWDGGVSPSYRGASELTQIGVIHVLDMTQEAALAKLAYVLGKTDWPVKLKRKAMRCNLAGEISLPVRPYPFFDLEKEREKSSEDNNTPEETNLSSKPPIVDDVIE